MDAKGIIKHKEINDSKTAFSVDDALSILLTSKIPLFDNSALEGNFRNELVSVCVRS